MVNPSAPIRRIALAFQSTLPQASEMAGEVRQSLENAGIQTPDCFTIADLVLKERINAGNYDLLIALGGDGTMLRAGRLCGPAGLPILGINVGHFGFLTEVKVDQWKARMPQLLEGHYRLEERMMLFCEHWRGAEHLDSETVLNEVVVCRGQVVRPIRIKAEVDGYPLASYVADGIMAATPTGSTGYAMAAGGPILPPEMRSILIMPIAPHLSMNRGIVLPENTEICFTAYTTHQAMVSYDGHPAQLLLDGDQIRVRAAQDVVRFVRFQDPGYFYRNLTAYMETNPSAGSST
jgi:NAD+ kinase